LWEGLGSWLKWTEWSAVLEEPGCSFLCVYCYASWLPFLSAILTTGAQVFVRRYQTVCPLLSPAGFCTASIFRAAHANWTIVFVPTGIKLKKVRDGS